MTFITGQQWNRIGVRHHHGAAFPLSALHSRTSAGCGDFDTLREILPILHAAHFDIVQLLPINDTGLDSSPYMGLSGYALNPLYLALPSLHHFFDNKERLQKWKQLKKEESNNPSHFDFVEISKIKWQLLCHYLDEYQFFIEQTPEFKTFCTQQSHWLESNATFKALKEYHGHIAWWDWKKEYQHFPCALPKECQAYAQRWKVVQFLCFTQLKALKAYAESLSILLMGDLPILLNKDSSDVWAHPELFDIHFEVGAPPDMYSKEGQNWGFPLYNWEGHFNQNLFWWKGRLSYAENFFHIYRLDHIVGFYRLYAILPGSLPNTGTFRPSAPETCLAQGEKILKALVESTSMFPIGEDLGDIPEYVRTSLDNLGISGTKVMRWERSWHEPGQPYIPLHQYNPESVTTVSTHDSSTLAGWTQEDPKAFQEALRAWNIPPSSQNPIHDLLRASHATSSLLHINLLNEYLSLCPEMTWKTEELNRINVPGTIGPLNWTFRFKPSIESLAANRQVQSLMHACVKTAS